MIEVLDIKDQPDCSVVLTLELNQKKLNAFVEYAVVDILRKHCNKEDYKPNYNDIIRLNDYENFFFDDEESFQELEKFTGP